MNHGKTNKMMVNMNAEQIHQLIKAEEYADHLIEAAFKHPEKLVDQSTPATKWKSINQRLLDLFMEESKKQTHCKQLKNTSHLLDKLVRKEHLNTLVVNLYPGNEGYSLMLRGRNGADSETIRLPYEESELLEYIDAEELPPVLLDLLDKAQANIFYSGCVIVELRDYRRTTTSSCDTRYVLLKPTPHTLLCDINSLTNDGHRWTQEDKFNLESQLLLHTNEPLCLDPSPTVFFVANKLNYERQKLNTHSIKQSVKKFSQASVNRKRKMAQCSAPKHLRLHDFVTKEREKIKKKAPVNPIKLGKPDIPILVPKPCVDMWRQRDVPLSPPESVEVEQFARVLEKPKITFDNTPVNVEEYTLESERSQGKLLMMRLTVQQRLSDDYYLGELYVDRDFIQGQMKGSTCKFSFGTRANVEKYIKQLTEIFTEKGSRSVKITHQLPGQPKMVTMTPAIQATPTSSTPQTPTTTTPTTVTAQTTVTAPTIQVGAGDASTKHTPPKISIPVNTPGGAASAMTNLLSPPANVPALSPIAGGTTIVNSHGQVQQLNLQQQQQLMSQQRARQQLGVYTGIQRPVTTPSPGSAGPGSAPQLPTYSQATGMAAAISTSSSSQTPNPTPLSTTSLPNMATQPSPALRTTTTSAGLLTAAALTVGTRRSSQPGQEGVLGQPQLVKISQGLLQATSLASYLQGSIQTSSTPTTPTTPTTAGGDLNVGSTTVNLPSGSGGQTGGSAPSGEGSGNLVAPNINLAGLTGLPSNINLQNLTGLQGLPNVQVSLAMTVPGGIAVPVPLGMISSASGLNPSILVGSMPGVHSATSGNASSSTTSTSSTQGGAAPVTSPPTLVTMVAPMPASSTTTVTSSGSAPVASAGVNNPTAVLTSPSNMLSLPIGVTGNLAQFMASPNLKGQGIKGTMPLSLLQLPGQQPVQLVSTSIPPGRGPLTATQALQATAQHQQQQAANQSKAPAGSSATSPMSVSSAMLTSPTLPGLTRGQPPTLTAQQLMQLTSHSPQHMAQLFHKPQLQHCQQIQLHQVKPPGSSKSKSKKRTAHTPPKS